MKIVVFHGGLGNQIFQYALYNYLKKHERLYVKYIYVGHSHNGMEIDQYFDVDLYKAHAIWNTIYNYCHVLLKKGINPFISVEGDQQPFKKLFIEGYWQNIKFINNDFIKFKALSLSNKNLLILDRMLGENSVCIHVRRGDYLLPAYSNIYGNVCTKEYYNKAIAFIRKNMSTPTFFIFSDDIDWVKDNLILENATYIDWNIKSDSIIDMYLMTHAKANIIANSSFSFWGAYLNKNTSFVIYPQKWYNDVLEAPQIFPDSWIGF